MGQPVAEPRRLDPDRARRLLGGLSLGAGERVLCLGPGGGAVAGLAASLVGPAGQAVEAEPDATAAGILPYADGEFDAVVVDLAEPAGAELERAGLLAEVARVTAPTGRVAVAVPAVADRDSVPVRQLATDAGLRGVAVRPDPGAGPEAGSVDFVTAFPPVPAGATDDPTTELPLPVPAGEPARQRGRLRVAGAVALVLAAAAGVGWGLAGAEPGDGSGPGAGSDQLAGDPELGGQPPGADGQPGAGDPPAGAGLPGNGLPAGSGSGSGSGTGSGSSGGGGPGNQPPVIEDLGLSSYGLTLTIAPTVRDPDGDEVSLAFEVDGEEVPATDPTRATISFSHAEVGEEYEASVTVTATDSGGASSWQTASHPLVANTTATVQNVTFRVLNPAGCFDAAPAHRLAGKLTLSGVAGGSQSFNEELRRDRPEVVLLESSTSTTPRYTAQRLTLEFAFDGQPGTYQKVHAASDQVARLLVRDDCSGWLFYRVTFEWS
jgi:hypothetical protein